MYTKLVNNTEQTVLETYSYPLLNGAPKILDYNSDIKLYNLATKVKEIAEKWKGIPLKGKAQDELIQDFIAAEVVDDHRREINTFRKCCGQFTKYGIIIESKKANQKDLMAWPQYLSSIKEEFKIITEIPPD